MAKYFSLLLGVNFKVKTLDELLDAINAETEMTLTDWSYVKASRSSKKTYVAEEQIPLLEKGLV